MKAQHGRHLPLPINAVPMTLPSARDECPRGDGTRVSHEPCRAKGRRTEKKEGKQDRFLFGNQSAYDEIQMLPLNYVVLGPIFT